MPTYDRVHILLEPQQGRALRDIARQQGCSLSHLVRECVRRYLAQRSVLGSAQDAQNRLARETRALIALAEIRNQIERRHGILDVDLVAQARQERDEDNRRVWRGEA